MARSAAEVGSGRRPFVGRVLLCAFALLAFAAMFSFAGCKYSDVLTQHTEDPDRGTLDEGADPTYESNPDAELIMDLAELSLDKADDENTQVKSLPHYDPDAPDNGPTKQRVKSPETPHDEEASEGTEQEDDEPADRSGRGNKGKQGGEPDEPTDGDEESENPQEDDPEDPEDPLISDEVEEPAEQPDDSGNGGETVVVDPEDGTTEDTAKGTVAAVGEYATIAQMLGGAGALAACDESWLAAREQDGCFSGELDRVEAVFAGDGTEAGSCNVDALVNTIKPSVVLWDGTVPNLSEDERAALEAAGITVQSVPSIGEQITEDYTVTQSVQAVASVLAGASGLAYDPLETASQYVSFHDEVLKTAYDTNEGFSYKVTDGMYDSLYQNTPLSGLADSTTTRVTTVYVDDLMTPPVSTAVVAQTASPTEGVIRLGHDGQTLDVSDGVGLSAATSTSAYMLVDYYLQLAGVVNNAYDTAQPESRGRRYIVMPGSTGSFGTSGNYASRTSSSALFYNAGDGTVTSNWHVLGEADYFPAVLVANDEIASAFVNSASKSDGLYRMDSPYRVIVVPSGIAGAWTEGHIDSFLMAFWAYGIKDAGNLPIAAEWAEAFYKDYLRCPDWSSAVADWNTSYTTESG